MCDIAVSGLTGAKNISLLRHGRAVRHLERVRQRLRVVAPPPHSDGVHPARRGKRQQDLLHLGAGLVDVVTEEILRPCCPRLVKTVCEPRGADADVQVDGRVHTDAEFGDTEPPVG